MLCNIVSITVSLSYILFFCLLLLSGGVAKISISGSTAEKVHLPVGGLRMRTDDFNQAPVTVMTEGPCVGENRFPSATMSLRKCHAHSATCAYA
ncbi:hypothetical protein CDAR_457131 [Caerostris darwini]|uniref:Secreted protein n=1 Tax=Caerostris darwini TaxID=1538125 RepID=A0AAV4PCW9_9ARAC|nr:hypothetical protein CDAR_457131 [Caerostris darwini]